MSRQSDPARIARLEEERNSLLSQLNRLDDELAAGDIDAVDHKSLSDDLTRRAAQVIRRLDRQRPPPVKRRQVSTKRRVLTVLAVAVVSVAAGTAVASFSGTRLEGQFGSGEIEKNSRDLLLDANVALASGDLATAADTAGEVLDLLPGDPDAYVIIGQVAQQRSDLLGAIQAYDQALLAEPNHIDALTWKGSILVRLPDPALAADGVALLDQAIAAGASTFEPYMWRAVAASDIEGDLEAAIGFYEEVLARNPPAPMVGVIEGNIASLQAELD
jgi:cytochrome c-type biogenesis protein CcmH/NrfG